jgi:hypothetical protein
MAVRATLAALVALALAAPCARAQQTATDYETLYGPPIDVSIADLVQGLGGYEGRTVRTKGRFEFEGGIGRTYLLRDSFNNAIRVQPMGTIAANFNDAAMDFLGREVEVTGLFQRLTSQTASPVQGIINFWEYTGPPAKDDKGPAAALLALEALVLSPDRYEGKTVRVVGQFRGRNLFGDLPSRSQRNSADWVVKQDLFAIWVSGRKPKGEGFELDAGLRRDTGKWLEVQGKVDVIGGVVYLRATRLALARPPAEVAAAEAKPPPPPPEKPKEPPVVVFALPLDGDIEVGSDARFLVQFSKDMDEKSFNGHVVLRYAGNMQPGDRPFDGARLGYDGGRRTLIVDPGDRLRPGREVELLLLDGIVDVEGLALIPRREPSDEEGVVDSLRYRIVG